MFKVLSGRKRRVISPATIAASVAAHVLLLGGAVYAAASNRPRPVEDVDDIWEVAPPMEPEPQQPVEPAPPPPEPAPREETPDEAPVPGTTLQIPDVQEVPEGIQPDPPGVQPVDPRDYTGVGPVGDYIGDPGPDPQPPTGSTEPPAADGDDVRGEWAVEERPRLDHNALGRVMSRYYPEVLRDSRVAGRVVIELIVDADGRVREGSARVVEASHPAFGDAAMRAAGRFRFTPARVNGIAVPVRVTLPINWSVPQ
jgi:periplasmic protein TonB